MLVQPILPGIGAPAVQVLGDPLRPSEAGPCPAVPYVARLCRFSALDDAFAGQDADARQRSRADMAQYLVGRGSGFAHCGAVGSASLQLFTYAKPYEVQQATFLARDRNRDFLPPRARAFNDWRGDRACPLGRGVDLRKSFGSAAWFDSQGMTLRTDNRLNPYRWIAPINQIHHHEQPSLSLIAATTPRAAAASALVLAQALHGPATNRILLDYDLDLSVQDERAALGEQTFTDFLRNADGRDLFSRTAAELAAYARQMGAASPEILHLQQYYKVRYAVPTIQLSLAVNFQQDGVRWRDAEFMLAGKTYQPSSTAAFAPVSDAAWLALIPEGGNSGRVAWNRLRIDGLTPRRVAALDPALRVIRSGGDYVDIPDGDSTWHLTGEIDLSDYYVFAIRARIFPGSSGTWNGVPQSAIVAATGLPDGQEHHCINSVGVLYEVHGPFALTLTVHRLDLRLQSRSGRPLPG